MPTARNPHSRPMQAGQISNHKYNNSAIKYAVLVAFASVHFGPNARRKDYSQRFLNGLQRAFLFLYTRRHISPFNLRGDLVFL